MTNKPKHSPRRRIFLPFWLQLFGSFLLVLFLVGGMSAYTWPHVERRVFNIGRVFFAMSAAESAAAYFDPSVLYETDADIEARAKCDAMKRLRRLYGAAAFVPAKDAGEPPAPPDPDAVRVSARPILKDAEAELDALVREGDFYDYVLEFSLVVPTQNGWVRWLSSDDALVGKPFVYGKYLDAYMGERHGFDNALNEDGQFTVFLEEDPARIREIEEERTTSEHPPRNGMNAATDPILSVRGLKNPVDPTLMPERAQALGIDFSRAALVAEYPRERILARTYLLKLIFFGILTLASFIALVAAIVLTVKINRPVRKLYDAMNEVSMGHEGVRVEGVRANDEIGRLATRFNEMMTEIESSREITAGVELAARIQRGLVPDPPTDLPGLDIAAWYHPSAQVSGDYYDFIRVGDRIFLAIGDAVGHGVDSGLIMATARAMLRTILETEDRPGMVLSRLNRLLSQDFRDGNFLTCAVACIDLKTNTIVISSAGHEPVLHVSGNVRSSRVIQANNPPLGLFETMQFKESPPLALHPSDLIILCSDGIRECHDPDRRLFGMERFLATVVKPCGIAAEVVEFIQLALRDHARGRPLDDDVSLVVVRAVPIGEAGKECRRPKMLFSD